MSEFPGDWANVAQSVIATTALTPTSASAAVTSGHGVRFPSSGPFALYIGEPSRYEIVKATPTSTDNFGILRGQMSTTAKDWAIGTPVYLYQAEGMGDVFGLGSRIAGNMGVMNLLGNTAVATGAAGTIATAALSFSRVNPAADRTGCILEAGTADGQVIIVMNVSASKTITFAASGTSNVADGTSDVIAALSAAMYVWGAATSLWYRV
jgi:hypothetical protein